MPSDTQGILLVPPSGDPHELLAWGPCGARPPVAVRRTYPRVVHESNEWGDPTYNGEKCVACDQPWPCETPGKVESEGHVRWQPGNRHTTVPDALVLAWGGKPVAEGTYWLYYRMGFDAELEESLISVADLLFGRSADVYWLRRIGTIVLLDAEGREVTDAE